MEPVAITGLGVLCCLGSGTDAFWRGLATARPAPAPVGDPHARMPLPICYAVPDGAVPDRPDHLGGLPLGRASRMAVAAARQALAAAKLTDAAGAPYAIVVGTGMGDSGPHEQQRCGGSPDGKELGPAFVVGSALGDALGWTGPCISVSNACSAGGYSLTVAADLIRAGEADVALAGGADAYSRVALACFNRLGAIDPLRCRPFDARRRGTVFAEGAAMLVLESARHAERRGALPPVAWLLGDGWSCDAHHPTAPEPQGQQIRRAMRAAIEGSGSDADAIGCVIPHGTGTALNDMVESRALHAVFGPRCARLPLYSLKALVGHTGGAAGALAAVTGALIAHRRAVPPNAPLDEPDPDCPVWLPDGGPTPLAGRHILVNAYAFGGNNVSFVLAGGDPR